MSASADFNNPLRKFKLVFLGEQSGECVCIHLSRSYSGAVILTRDSRAKGPLTVYIYIIPLKILLSE